MKAEDLDYANFYKLLAPYEKKGREASRAFLNWFLEHIFRLDETLADDCICDGSQDKGIDAIYIDELNEEINIFQSTTAQSTNKTIGDCALKEFSGTLDQLSTQENIDLMLNGNANDRIKKILGDLDVKNKLGLGYAIKGIYVSNIKSDKNTLEYLNIDSRIKVFDKDKISSLYVDLDQEGGITQEFTFDCSEVAPLEFSTGGNIANVYVFPALASELVAMDGIDDGSLFQQNVRLALGSTKVNRSIKNSINDKTEHVKFPLYHNGITIICKEAALKEDNNKISIKNYVVVNGAQSITTLHNHKKNITKELKILTKIIELKNEDPSLIKRITTNSNNQNAIKPRDLQSNQSIQQRLKNEFDSQYQENYAFEIKRGDNFDTANQIVISNEDAGRMLLTFDLGEPSNSHQKSKIFDEYYSKIFGRPNVDAARIIFIFELMRCVEKKLDLIKNKSFAHYSATKFFLLHVLAEIMKRDRGFGNKIYKDPKLVMHSNEDFNKFMSIMSSILENTVIIDLNYYLEEQPEFDYKKITKNSVELSKITKELLNSYEKDLKREKTECINDEWNKYLRTKKVAA